MTVEGDIASDPFAAEVERIRASGVLGRSHGLARVFDYLAAHARDGAALREIDVATDVFGRNAAVDLSGDASVRVYVHRLRRKLDEFYAGPAADAPFRLSVPRGEYRLALEPRSEPEAAADLPAPAPRKRPMLVLALVGLAVVVILNSLAWFAFIATRTPPDGLDAARRSAVWREVTGVERPVLLVVGDYYIFGDTGEELEVQRLVREFTINSRADLDEFLMVNPQLMDRYVDMDLHYVPVGGALALRSVLPLLRGQVKDWDRVRVITASELTPELLKANDIVYVGYLSALGLLHDPVFQGSRLAVGQSYDEIVDRVTGRRYFSEAGGPVAERAHRDYSYLASFAGPGGNRIVVIAGTRDIGVMQAAEAATTEAPLRRLAGRLPKARGFEALYEVEGIGRTNFSGQPLMSAARNAAS
jgi:hypothetical protein